VAGSEQGHLLAAFNGGFKFPTGSGGFMSYGRVAVPLRAGLGSVVSYSNGRTDVGAWGSEVPQQGLKVVSVRQNLPLLIDNGRAASNLGCLNCWGATLGGVVDPARSSLGKTADGRLVWVAGEHLTVAALADALLRAGAVRAVQLDINPYWVAGYLYGHRGGKGPLAPVPVVAGQSGIPGQYLAPWSRDFFTIVAP
jgi:phosphodiester glycosidase